MTKIVVAVQSAGQASPALTHRRRKEKPAAMILIGTMNITRTRDEGEFHCPTCGSLKPYQLKSRRPFLTLYFIPTVPIGGTEYFVRCLECKSHWDPAILGGSGSGLHELQ